MQTTGLPTYYHYPMHEYSDHPTYIKPSVQARHRWTGDSRYRTTIGNTALLNKHYLWKDQFEAIAAKACYHCFVCPAGYVVAKDTKQCLDANNALPACSTCRRRHVKGNLPNDEFGREKSQRPPLVIDVDRWRQ